jgi:DNA polymerase I-like protein with 3'-5' exonuclease and polymerase domains
MTEPLKFYLTPPSRPFLSATPEEAEKQRNLYHYRVKVNTFIFRYGRPPESIEKSLGISEEEAKKLISKFNKKCPDVRLFPVPNYSVKTGRKKVRGNIQTLSKKGDFKDA